MGRIIASLVLLLSLVLVPFAIASNGASADPGDGGPTQASAASADGLVSCRTNPRGHEVEVICKAAGVVILDVSLPIPVVNVTLPPVTIHATVRVPGPTHTVTQLQGGPTATVTAHSTAVTTAHSTATATITIGPGAVPTARPTATVTVTKIKKVAGHTRTRHATLDHNNTVLPDIVFGGGVVQKTAVGLGVILGLVALLLLGMWLGYYLGYKDCDRNEAKFLDALLRKD